MTLLTYDRLEAAGACRDQLALFKRKYGASVAVTVEAAREVAEVFNWEWASRALLDPPAHAAYRAATAEAHAAYRAATAEAHAAYRAATAETYAAYRAATAEAHAAYNAATAEACAAYNAATAEACAAYRAATAEAWALAFIESEGRAAQ